MPSGEDAKKEIPNVQKYWPVRILIALLIWITITAISLRVAWHQADNSIAWWRQQDTQRELKVINNAIVAYKQKFGSSPTNFDQIGTMTNEIPDFAYLTMTTTRDQSSSMVVDRWDHPLVISNYEGNWVVISYGRDGKPGGIGIDYDLTSANPYPKEALPTFDQFRMNDDCQGMIATSFFCGGFSAVLSLLTVRIPNLKSNGIIFLLLSLVATIVATLFTTMIITALHIPSGH